jgi:hypothetical protein
MYVAQHHGLSVGHDLDRAIDVRPPHGQAGHRGKVLERDGVRMAVRVAGTTGDDGDPRLKGRQ